MRSFIVILHLIILALSSSSCISKSASEYAIQLFHVTRVVDGDTFCVNDGTDEELTIRLIGVDAPETRNTRMKQKGPYAEEAKEFLRLMIEGKMVRLEFDIDSLDHYQRTLAYVYTDKNLFVNAELVKQGYAMIMTYPPNVKYAEHFLKLQQKARMKGRGLWGSLENEIKMSIPNQNE